MELPRALPVNIRISVRLPRLDLNSSVLVRHCTSHGPKYVIGVAFQRTPSEALRAAPAIEDRQQHYPEQDPALESWNAITQPPDDDVRTYFQDLKTRKSGRSASTKARRRMWLRVALAVSGAVGVLFILTLPRLLRYATESYQHPLLQKASAFVEAMVNYGHKKL